MWRKIERGEIWWINLDPTRGAEIRKQRPCVVLSANAINRTRLTPVVVPLSASADDAPPIVVAIPSAGKDAVAILDQIRAVDRSRFVSKQGKIAPKDLNEIENSLKQVLELP